MNTAMQIHIRDMEKIKQMVISKKVDKDLEETIIETIEGCLENAKAYLNTEKQQIINAYLTSKMIANGKQYAPMASRDLADEYYLKSFGDTVTQAE
jgi:hypothetical protein